MWILIYIFVLQGNPEVVIHGKYSTLLECFESREKLAVDVGGDFPGYFPNNSRGICVRLDR